MFGEIIRARERSQPMPTTDIVPVAGVGSRERDATLVTEGSRLPEPLRSFSAIGERDSYTSTALAELLDRATHAAIAKSTFGLSPASLIGAYLDWATHLAASPGKRLQLTEKAWRKWLRLQQFVCRCAFSANGHGPCIEPLPQDKRFVSPGWQKWPFNIYYQSHLLAQQWWHVATTGVPGLSLQHERMLEFTARQILDVFSPSNFILTNPDVLQQTVHENGRNLVRGWQHMIEDWDRSQGGRPPVGAEAFQPGRDVAVTPGKVVLRNGLIELIQYSPSTGQVRPEPVLIVPAWIMKYYILDLSPQNSLIRYLVDQGFTVFAMSWKNPDPEARDTSLEDYRRQGVLAALEAIAAIVPGAKVHGAGYCLGGTLLAIAAAALARNGDTPFASLSFLAAQVDFTEPGELQLFINESQLRFLEDMMWEQGFLDAKQMSGAFQLLRSNDLIWSRMMREYLLGERTSMTDMMAWNADTTRMPYRMHADYLRRLYLNNDLAEGRYKVDGRPVTIADIRQPLFCVGTVKDHVAPWRSVYKWTQLADTNVTFVLTEGGHNAGIVSEPGHPHRSYRIATHHEMDLHMDADTWAAETPVRQGSWWEAWVHWLAERSGEPVPPPPLGAADRRFAACCDAPGLYVHET
jgi:polyhydroxyalkanoate synthase